VRIIAKRLGPFVIAYCDKKAGATYWVERYGDDELGVTTISNAATKFTDKEVDRMMGRLAFEFPNVEFTVRDIPFRIVAKAS
jgi:hypothetical protein